MPSRRAHDHIGAFNFKVEVEGVTAGAFFEGWPCRYSLSTLNGASDRTLFEEIEIAVKKIERG